jgi:hypothetical protein
MSHRVFPPSMEKSTALEQHDPSSSHHVSMTIDPTNTVLGTVRLQGHCGEFLVAVFRPSGGRTHSSHDDMIRPCEIEATWMYRFGTVDVVGYGILIIGWYFTSVMDSRHVHP